MKRNSKIFIVVLILILISSYSKNSHSNLEIKSINRLENKTESKNKINLDIKINNPGNCSLKLIIIPPDSGFWIINEDTIHLDSLEN